jgi:acyl-CoA thioester hydrolase
MNNHMSGYMKEHIHHFPVRIYFSDTDAGGIVYHSRYLDMAEHARTEMLRCLDLSHQEVLEEKGTAFVVRRASLDFQKPAMLDDLVEVRTRGLKMSRFTLELVQEIFRGDDLLVKIDLRLAYIDVAAGRPSPLPAPWRDTLEGLII